MNYNKTYSINSESRVAIKYIIFYKKNNKVIPTIGILVLFLFYFHLDHGMKRDVRVSERLCCCCYIFLFILYSYYFTRTAVSSGFVRKRNSIKTVTIKLRRAILDIYTTHTHTHIYI